MLEDNTGTYVLALSGTYQMWKYYNEGKSAAWLAEQYPASLKKVNPSNIKDSSSDTLQVGDLYYDSGLNKFYYVNAVNPNESWPNGSWVPLIQ